MSLLCTYPAEMWIVLDVTLEQIIRRGHYLVQTSSRASDDVVAVGMWRFWTEGVTVFR